MASKVDALGKLLLADKLVFVAEGQTIAEHVRRVNRSHNAGETIYSRFSRMSPLIGVVPSVVGKVCKLGKLIRPSRQVVRLSNT